MSDSFYNQILFFLTVFILLLSLSLLFGFTFFYIFYSFPPPLPLLPLQSEKLFRLLLPFSTVSLFLSWAIFKLSSLLSISINVCLFSPSTHPHYEVISESVEIRRREKKSSFIDLKSSLMSILKKTQTRARRRRNKVKEIYKERKKAKRKKKRDKNR